MIFTEEKFTLSLSIENICLNLVTVERKKKHEENTLAWIKMSYLQPKKLYDTLQSYCRANSSVEIVFLLWNLQNSAKFFKKNYGSRFQKLLTYLSD